MSIVYILGAGASHGEKLVAIHQDRPGSLSAPPTTSNFFSHQLLESTRYQPDDVQKDYENLINWIKWLHLGQDIPVGEGDWNSINIEDVFTWLEIRREFENAESYAGGKVLLIRNELLSYIRRIIGLCTVNSYGEYARTLTDCLRPNDSIITFNWDLLLDECFVRQERRGDLIHYENFLKRSEGEIDDDGILFQQNQGTGLFLKLHGSLNWFQCTNLRCSNKVIFRRDIDSCLNWSIGINRFYSCRKCGSEASPMLVPPVLRKPIMDHEMIRASWGLAREVLIHQADVLVIIGFSVAPTDYYASWLLREAESDPTVRFKRTGMPPLKVFVVNPLNDKSLGEQHKEFDARMRKLFRQGYVSEFTSFSQIADICKRAAAEDGEQTVEVAQKV